MSSLKEAQRSLKRVLGRVATQEQKTRMTINFIPDYIIVINSRGEIVQSNKSFDKTFGLTEERMRQEVNVENLFLELKPSFYSDPSFAETPVPTIATTDKGTEEVIMVICNLNVIGNELITSNIAQEDMIIEKGLEEDEESFVIIARPILPCDRCKKKEL